MGTLGSATFTRLIRRAWTSLTILGSGGLLIAIVVSIISGVAYRIREEQGLTPIYAEEWVAAWTYPGLWIFLLALVGLAITGIVALIRR